MQKRVLLITNRNILTTCGELRLIKNRAESLFDQYGISTDFIVLANSKRINAEKKEEIRAGGVITEVLQDTQKPWTLISADRALRKLIKETVTNYTAVVLSGSGVPLYAKLVRKIAPKVHIFADVHGASEDIVELVKKSNFLKKIEKNIIFRIDKMGLAKSTPFLDGYFTVTPALKEYVEKRFEVNSDAKFIIAPCATSKIEESYINDYAAYRKEYREKFGIQPNERVFIYSGGVSSWQCIEDTLGLYRRIKQKNNNTRMLVFSHNIDEVKKLIREDDDIQAYRFAPEELKKALCAGDYAFLLRRDCITNNVAFPNKFLEYVLSGMKIITTPYLYEIANQVKKNNLGLLYKMDGDIDSLIQTIEEDRETINWSNRLQVLKYNGFDERLKPFVDEIME